jgi:hypothetical protein
MLDALLNIVLMQDAKVYRLSFACVLGCVKKVCPPALLLQVVFFRFGSTVFIFFSLSLLLFFFRQGQIPFAHALLQILIIIVQFTKQNDKQGNSICTFYLAPR